MDLQFGVRYPDYDVGERAPQPLDGTTYLPSTTEPRLYSRYPRHQLLRTTRYHLGVKHRHHLQAQTNYEQGKSLLYLFRLSLPHFLWTK